MLHLFWLLLLSVFYSINSSLIFHLYLCVLSLPSGNSFLHCYLKYINFFALGSLVLNISGNRTLVLLVSSQAIMASLVLYLKQLSSFYVYSCLPSFPLFTLKSVEVLCSDLQYFLFSFQAPLCCLLGNSTVIVVFHQFSCRLRKVLLRLLEPQRQQKMNGHGAAPQNLKLNNRDPCYKTFVPGL